MTKNQLIRVLENPLGCPTGVYRIEDENHDYIFLKSFFPGNFIIKRKYIECNPVVTFWDKLCALSNASWVW